MVGAARLTARILSEHDLKNRDRRPKTGRYQPLIRLEDRRIVGAEAVLRWTHPVRGPVSPTEFIPLAEESGLIVPIGEWVLREACERAAQWRALPGHEDFELTVNLSARQLANADLVEFVAGMLEATGTRPDTLALELTETFLLEQSANTAAVLGQLEALGVGLMLDDFGTGYSSLSHLQRFPLDAIKVDRSFVNEIGRTERCAAIIAAVVGMADGLGLRVIAEGVETEEHVAHLRALGCESAQGFLFARPCPPAGIAALLSAERSAAANDGCPPRRGRESVADLATRPL